MRNLQWTYEWVGSFRSGPGVGYNLTVGWDKRCKSGEEIFSERNGKWCVWEARVGHAFKADTLKTEKTAYL